MSWYWFPWWIVANAALGHVVWQWWRRRRAKRRARSHDMLMLRIARLELALGVGLDYAEKWLRKRPVLRDELGAKCWGCGRSIYLGYSYSSRWSGGGRKRPYDPELEARLCTTCIDKAHAELELL